MKRHQALLHSRSIQNQTNILPTHKQLRNMQASITNTFQKKYAETGVKDKAL